MINRLTCTFICTYLVSHLCDTRGGLSEGQLCIETKEADMSRRFCTGINLIIYRNPADEFLT